MAPKNKRSTRTSKRQPSPFGDSHSSDDDIDTIQTTEAADMKSQLAALTEQVTLLAAAVKTMLPPAADKSADKPTDKPTEKPVIHKPIVDESTKCAVMSTPISFTVDLSRDLPKYDGSSNAENASDWLTAWKAVISIHALSDHAAVEIARRVLTGAAKDWYTSHYPKFNSVSTFTSLFEAAFVPQSDIVTLTQRMLDRDQRPGEDVMFYVHEKVKLLTPLNLPLPAVRKHLSKGTRWNALGSHILNANASDVDGLVEAIRIFVDCQSPSPRQFVTKTTKPNSTSAKNPPSTSAANPKRTTAVVGDQGVKCYNCFAYGHYSKECTAPRRVPKCTACGEQGHVRSKCPKTPPTPKSEVLTTAEKVLTVTEVDCRTISKYQRRIAVNGQVFNAIIDPGSCDCLTTIDSICELKAVLKPCNKVFTGIGANAERTRALGYAILPLSIDTITLDVPVYAVPTPALPVPFIIGRTWTENPSVVYARIGEQLRFLPLDDFTIRQLAVMVENTRAEPPPPSKVLCCESLPSERLNFVGFVTTAGPIVPCYLPLADKLTDTHVGRILLVDHADLEIERLPTTKLYQPYQLNDINAGPIGENEKQELLSLINKYRRAFADNIYELGGTNLIKMKINEVPNSHPCAQRPYRTSLSQSRALTNILREWEELGIIRPSTSPYAAPALLMDKKTGEKRAVFDYRRLNAQTVSQPFPMPNIDDQLSELSNATLYTVIDLFSGYLQVPMEESSIPLTAFVTSTGHYEFLRMPFGLKNAPAVFQSLMNKVLGRIPERTAFCYLDDVIIPATSFVQMLKNLEAVLSSLQSAGLTCRLTKCKFAVAEIEFLGFIITAGHIKPGVGKTKVIEEFPRPTDVHTVRRFLGLTGFFRRFVAHYAIIAKPLSMLLKKRVEFTWTETQENAFTELKQRLTCSPVLRLFDPSAPIEVHTDASAIGVGGMLMQIHEGRRHLVYAVSKSCTPAESLYHSSRLELLAVVWTLTRLRQFLIGTPFTVVTDCQSLIYLHKSKVGNGQLARWAVFLSEYDCQFVHRAGTDMMHVDALSRAPLPGGDGIEAEIFQNVLLIETAAEETIRTFQNSDEEIKNLIRYVTVDGRNQPESRHYVVANGILYRVQGDRRLFVVPKCMRKSLLVKFHDNSGHYSTEKVVAALMRDYWFQGMRRYVKQHIRRCIACLTRKGPSGRTQGLLQPIPPPDIPFKTVHADHLGPLPVSDNYSHILVIIDALTRYVELYACVGTTSRETVKHFDEFATRFGYPKNVITDRGTAFTAAEDFVKWADDHAVHHTLVSTRHPQGNGLVERVNRVLIGQFTIYCEEGQHDWYQYLGKVRRNVNAAVNRSTGRSPFELLYGFQPHFVDNEYAIIYEENERREDPANLRAEAVLKIAGAQEAQKRHFDRRHCPGEELSVGQIVFAKTPPVSTGTPTKFQPKYRGPLVVVRKIASDTYRCQSLNTEGKLLDTNFHISALRPLGSDVEDT